MVINSNVVSLFKSAPGIDGAWKERLARWLKVLSGTQFSRVFQAQLEMIDAVVALETKMRRTQQERKTLKAQIPTLKSQDRMEQVRSTQMQASRLEAKIADLQYTRHCILFVGDTIASHILEEDAIKHFAAYQPPGFLSGKKGLRAEVEAAHKFYRDGYIVVINDLTHCLRVGDLTLRKGDEVRTFEVKTSAKAYFTPDATRQILTPMLIHDYIKEDVLKVPVKMAGRKEIATGGIARVNSGEVEDWHDRVAGKIYRALRQATTARVQIGKKIYLACRRKDQDVLRGELDDLTQSGQWVVANVRRRVTNYPDIPPFSRWFKADTGTKIMTGDLVVLSAFAMADLAELFEAKGVRITWEVRPDDLFPIHFTSKYLEEQEKLEFCKTNIGDWHRLRMLYSFLAVESFVEICSFLLSPEAMAQFEAKLKPQEKPQD